MRHSEYQQCLAIREAAMRYELSPNDALAQIRAVASTVNPFPVRFYTARFDEDDLASLESFAARVRRRSIRLSLWMVAVVNAERRRRESLETGIPMDATFANAE